MDPIRLALICLFSKDASTTELYTLSLHDALPISQGQGRRSSRHRPHPMDVLERSHRWPRVYARFERSNTSDRKSTRLNSSHMSISYAVFCLKKKSATGPVNLIGEHTDYNDSIASP